MGTSPTVDAKGQSVQNPGMFDCPCRVSSTIALHPATPGKMGAHQTLRVMRDFVRAYRMLPIIRERAISILRGVPEKDTRAEAEAIFEWVRSNVRYTSDIHEVETLAAPDTTMALGAGDCDDQSVLFASLCESIGIPSRFVLAGYSTSDLYEHVYTQVLIDGEWISADTTENQDFGWEANHSRTRYHERV